MSRPWASGENAMQPIPSRVVGMPPVLNWIIHEMLHTLGLGENPPSSREITQRVNERCQ